MISGNRAHPKVEDFPPDVVSAINDAIVNKRKTYQQIVEWLKDDGYEISKSSLQRYGSKFLTKLEKISTAREQAKSIIETSSGLKTEMSEATSTVAFQLLMDMLINTDSESGDLDKNTLSAIRTLATLERSSISREKLKFEFNKGVNAAVDKITKALNAELKNHPDVLAEINKILTIATEPLKASGI